jgi:CRISPR-associated protein Cmr6
MPVIPGSSVKGLLRSVFPHFDEDEVKAEFDEERIQKAADQEKLRLKKSRASFCWWLVKRQEKESLTVEELKWLHKVEQAIFESMIDGKVLSNYKRDIFHDAYIEQSNHKGGYSLANDFVTSHLEPLKNPIPVQFLKVLPSVRFRFVFELQDNGGPLSSSEKKELFRHILLTLGIGAKTHVGYGQFTD